MLSKNDFQLIAHNLNERTITHKLAEYLQALFSEYHVDCEYNRDVDQGGSQLKRINILKDRYEAVKGKVINGSSIDVSVYPDIIVHRRGTNASNLLVIELKKTTNTDNDAREFDLEKLRCFTDQSERNTLKYDFGVFLLLETRVGRGTPDKFIVEEKWFATDNNI
jgi:hypothetical protein